MLPAIAVVLHSLIVSWLFNVATDRVPRREHRRRGSAPCKTGKKTTNNATRRYIARYHRRAFFLRITLLFPCTDAPSELFSHNNRRL
ncbi:hypothetical protein FN846DRAFT_933687 [Sphaerosporella brunnea]|uniref:Secreted protein n=1 Tax=Sphaerosporella brunnea TaxID=1250544 RepID=A0A5J5F6A5_9PEZI|nr:hypothetical protein FN846DRAFT_933687 [Sphaerosporella brunnea]